MTKEEFNNLTVLEQLRYVNSLNAGGMSLRNKDLVIILDVR